MLGPDVGVCSTQVRIDKVVKANAAPATFALRYCRYFVAKRGEHLLELKQL